MIDKNSTVKVDLGTRSYPILIKRGILEDIGDHAAKMGYGGRAAVITQRVPGSLFEDLVVGSLEKAGFTADVAYLPEGEEAKTLEQVSALYEFFIRHGMDRWSPVFALGGGTVGDAAGFAAGTYMRGTPLFHVPTTLVSQVDSSIGGKVALNHPAAKNTIGIFYQPRAVFTDPLTLDTLAERDMVAGMAEVIRYAAIADEHFFAYLEKNMPDILSRNRDYLLRTIRRCCEIKADIVQRDEREEGDTRALLNYGHTIGHALEAATGYADYRHGEAVAVGMAVAARLACNLGICSLEVMERQINLLKKAGLPINLRGISTDSIVNSLKLDKKIRQGKVRFVLTEAVGRAKVFDGVSNTEIVRAISDPQPARTGFKTR